MSVTNIIPKTIVAVAMTIDGAGNMTGDKLISCPQTAARTKVIFNQLPRANLADNKPNATIPVKRSKLITGSAIPQINPSQIVETLCSIGDPPAEVSKVITTKILIAPKRSCCLEGRELTDLLTANREFLNILRLCSSVINITINYYKK
jgi:hypothetical protein